MEHFTTKEGKIIQINDDQIQNHLKEIVRNSVQETLNMMLDEEADRLCQASR